MPVVPVPVLSASDSPSTTGPSSEPLPLEDCGSPSAADQAAPSPLPEDGGSPSTAGDTPAPPVLDARNSPSTLGQPILLPPIREGFFEAHRGEFQKTCPLNRDVDLMEAKRGVVEYCCQRPGSVADPRVQRYLPIFRAFFGCRQTTTKGTVTFVENDPGLDWFWGFIAQKTDDVRKEGLAQEAQDKKVMLEVLGATWNGIFNPPRESSIVNHQCLFPGTSSFRH
jgi:hypothetical protein